MTKIMLSTPTVRGLSAGYVTSLLTLGRALAAKGIALAVDFESGNSLISGARANLVDRFMATDATHCLMIDDDITYEAATVEKLLALECPFAGVAVPRKTVDVGRIASAIAKSLPDPFSHGLDFCLRHDEKKVIDGPGGAKGIEITDGAIDADAIGGAFMLFTRDVITKLQRANPDLRYKPKGSDHSVWDLFATMVQHGQSFSEDYAFCRRWRKLGGRIRVLVDAPVIHEGPTPIAGNYATQLGVT